MTLMSVIYRMREMLRTDISFESDVVKLSQFCLPCPFSFFLSDMIGGYLELRVGCGSLTVVERLLVGWHNIELCGVPPARQVLVCVAGPAIRHDLESPHWLLWLHCYAFLTSRDTWPEMLRH